MVKPSVAGSNTWSGGSAERMCCIALAIRLGQVQCSLAEITFDRYVSARPQQQADHVGVPAKRSTVKRREAEFTHGIDVGSEFH